MEAFKYESGPEATLVTATMDWNTFSVRDLSSWKVRFDGERTLVVNLHQLGNSNQIIVGGKLRLQKLDQTTTMEYYPWHSYDFDFASLNLILPHLIDPLASFAFGVADFPNKRGQAPSFDFKGLVSMDFVSDEVRNGTACRMYSIDGPGLENRGGTIWVDKALLHIVDYEIDLPDEPGYESGKLLLKKIDHMDYETWREFMLAQIT